MTAVAVSAIVVNHRREELLAACLASITDALGRIEDGGELIVVDNGSGDGSCERVRREHPGAALVELPENRGFATGVEEGLRHARGEWILTLNNDATIEPDAIAEMLAVGRSATDVGSVAAQLRFARGHPVINSAGIEIDRLGVAFDRLLGRPVQEGGESTEVFGASAGAALYRRAMLDDVGGFDRTFFVFMEDADLAWRARMQGWRCLYAPRAIAHHHHSATASHGSDFKHFHVGLNRVRLLAKNADARMLRRYGVAIAAYDLAYVVAHALIDLTLAPLRGRLAGLRQWREYRAVGAGRRRPVALVPVRGLRAASARRATYLGGSSP